MNVLKRIKNWLVPYQSKRICFSDKVLTVHFMDYQEIQKEWKRVNPKSDKKVNGFSYKDDVFVMWDYTKKDLEGEYLPNTECLGHEMLHQIYKWKFHN